MRSTTPAKDFMEARGWAWGPVDGGRLRKPLRLSLSGFEKRAAELARYAYRLEQARAKTAPENRRPTYSERMRAAQEARHGA